MATLLHSMHVSEPTVWAQSALPAIKGSPVQPRPERSALRSESPLEASLTQAPVPEVNLDAEAVLLKQAEHWHQLYLDLEATCAKAKREQAMLQQQLNEALDRERHWAAKNLELRSHDAREEALHKARLAEQLANSRLLCQNKEESLCMLRCQVEAKDEELDKVRREQRQGMELCKRLEKTLAQMAEKERLADQKDAELSKTKTELQKEKDICARALQEVREQSKAEASLRQQLGDLKDQQRGLARENEQLRRPLEEEVAKRAALAQQLTSTGLLLKGKEEENAALRSQLVAKEEEVETLRRASRRASLSEQQTEAERAELARKLAEVAQRAATKDQLCEQKDSELGKLRTELKTERSLCQSAMQEASEIRSCYTKKLGAMTEREQAQQQSLELLDAERKLWLTRSDHLEQDNARLRADLQTSLASGAEMGVALVRDASVKALGEVAKMGLSPRAPRRFSNPCVRCPAEPGTPSEPMSR